MLSTCKERKNEKCKITIDARNHSSFITISCCCLFLPNDFRSPNSISAIYFMVLVIALGLRLGFRYQELQDAITKGISNGLEAILILVAVGALIGTWIAGGVVPTLIYYGLEFIHPSIFLLATLIICSITSIATGTSWGTVGTAGIAMMAIGEGLGLPLPLVAGAVLSGAYFGDNYHHFLIAQFLRLLWRK